MVRGECTQTYVPYLFLVIPLGPVTLTGQDYVLVESGCVCKPKGSRSTSHELVSTIPAMPRPQSAFIDTYDRCRCLNVIVYLHNIEENTPRRLYYICLYLYHIILLSCTIQSILLYIILYTILKCRIILLYMGTIQ